MSILREKLFKIFFFVLSEIFVLETIPFFKYIKQPLHLKICITNYVYAQFYNYSYIICHHDKQL